MLNCQLRYDLESLAGAWPPPPLLSHENLVLMTGSEARRHFERGGTVEKNKLLYDEAVLKRVRRILCRF